MKSLRWLMLVVMVLGLAGVSTAAERPVEMFGDPPGCESSELQDKLAPSNRYYSSGDVIDYSIEFEILPPGVGEAPGCNIRIIEVWFWAPDDPQIAIVNPIDICDSPGGVQIVFESDNLAIPSGGGPLVLDAATYSELLYTASAADMSPSPADPTLALRAYYCIIGEHQTDLPVGMRDEKASVNQICTPCMEITKEVDCEWSKVGDWVEYEICIENCGNGRLENITVVDDHLGDLSAFFPDDLAPGGSFCEVFPYQVQSGDDTGLPGATIVNTATMEALAICGENPDTWLEIELDPVSTPPVTVTLLHPALTVDVECLSPGDLLCGEDAEFGVTITNDGDVELDLDITPLPPVSVVDPLPAGGTIEYTYTEVCECPPGEVTYQVDVMGTIPPEYCNLPNEIPASDAATCECGCPAPCIEITKEACEYSKVGDPIVYTYCLTNCGQHDLIDIVVTDSELGVITSIFPAGLVLAPGATVCADYTYTVAEEDWPGPIENTATVTATDDCDGVTATDDASELVTVTLINPSIDVNVECAPDQDLDAGPKDFYVEIVNDGDVPLDISTTDPANFPGGELAPGGSYSGTVTLECDPPEVCYEITVTWAIPDDEMWCDMNNFGEVTASACCPCETFENGRWTGGGTIDWEATIPDGAHVTHGFEFHCNPNCPPNNLEVNWTGGHRFHMLEMLTATCRMNPDSLPPYPPKHAPINEVYATGTGRYDNVEGYFVEWHFTDHGEPGYVDWAQIKITAPDGFTVVLDARGHLKKGNHQSHRENKCRDLSQFAPGTGTNTGAKTPPTAPTILDSDGLSETTIPREFSVRGFPNPAGNSASIRYALPMDSRVTVEILDVQGRIVETLLDQQMPGGSHTVAWEGQGAPAGVYFCRVQCCDGQETVTKVIKVQ